MKITDLFDINLFNKMVEEKYVIVRQHDQYPLSIAGYSDKAQFDRRWNEVTLNCRGLIYNTDTLEIVARPWKKFFNNGEANAAWIDYNSPIEVTDKLDGSLGILYRVPAGEGLYGISTRGSFHSEQAKHATMIWISKYESRAVPMDGYTFLFEIIYPDNRIVLDYGSKDDLVLLGCVETGSGYVYGPREAAAMLNWPGEITEVFNFATISDMLAAPDRANTEGYVIRQGNKMVKWKRPDYVELHRLISNLSEKSVWAGLSSGKTALDICEDLPDEFHGFVKETAARFMGEFSLLERNIYADYYDIVNDLGPGFSRAHFAKAASTSLFKSYMFSLLDGKSIDSQIWVSLKPKGESPVRNVDAE